MIEQADIVITMGCGADKACPGLLKPAEDWSLPDPRGKDIDEFRKLREEIKQRVRALIERLKDSS